jgi:DNA-binding XRE family transcriptional regulator
MMPTALMPVRQLGCLKLGYSWVTQSACSAARLLPRPLQIVPFRHEKPIKDYGMPSAIDVHLGRRLRRRRRLLGLTQQQLAVQVGVRFQQIQKYECGANRLGAARLWALAEALETPISYFYDGLEEQLAQTVRSDLSASTPRLISAA